MSIPSVPQIFIRPDAIDQSLRFFWDPPLSDGGSPVTSYFLTDGTLFYTIPSTQLSYQVSGLTNGTSYSFSLAASNANGLGPASFYRTVQPGFVPSSIITLSTLSVNNSSFTVYWETPSTVASLLGYSCKAYPVDSNYSTLIDSISVITKQANLAIRNKEFALPSTVNWRIGVSGVNDPGYAPPAFTSTFLLATDPKGSMYFQTGIGTKITTPVDSELNLGTSDFTIQWWENSQGIYESFYNGTNLSVQFNGSTITLVLNNTTYTISNVNTILAWHHFVLQRSGNVFSFFIDGTLVWTQTLAITLTLTGDFEFGGRVTSYISNFSWLKGTALYTSAGFTPPRINFSVSSQTKLLLLSRTYEYTYLDSSVFNRQLTPYDFYTLSTLSTLAWSSNVPPSVPFGSLYFVGSNRPFVEYRNPTASLWGGTGDFSIEFFMYLSTIPSGKPIIFQIGNSSNTNPLTIDMAYPGFIGNTSLSFLSSIPGPPAPIPFSINLPYGIYSTNTWQHFFIERFSGNLYVGTDMRASNINTYQRITSFSNNLLTTTSSLFIGYPISSVGIGDTFLLNFSCIFQLFLLENQLFFKLEIVLIQIL